MTLLLEGNIDNRDEIIASLEDNVARLEQELAVTRAEVSRAKGENARAISALRRQLAPLYQALQQVFGAIEAIPDDVGTPTQPSAYGMDTRQQKVWESWKQKLPQTASKIIDALLTHGDLNTQQLAIATGLHRTTVPNGIHQLNKAGLINKNGGRFSLKQL